MERREDQDGEDVWEEGRGKEVWVGLEYLNSLCSVNRLYVLYWH